MIEELKSCPFCGGSYFEILEPFYAFVRCVGCGTEGSSQDTKAQMDNFNPMQQAVLMVITQNIIKIIRNLGSAP